MCFQVTALESAVQLKELYFKEKKGQYLMFDIQSGLTCNDVWSVPKYNQQEYKECVKYVEHLAHRATLVTEWLDVEWTPSNLRKNIIVL